MNARVGEITLYDEDDGTWTVAIFIERDERDYRLPGFKSPGKALDGAMRWARQRKLTLETAIAHFPIVRGAQSGG